jgi:hypothetical protein
MYINDKNNPSISEDEQCYDCLEQPNCPLHQLLYHGYLLIEDDFWITKCPFYKKTHLHVVK